MLKIRAAVAKDVPVILNLVSELAEYENCSAQVRATEADLSRDGFGANSEFRAFIAEWDGVTAGFALFFNHYSTWRGAGFYLEDLFVRREFRERGIGITLVASVARVAERENRNFIRWAVLDWNERAIGFYEEIGADFLDQWRTVVVTGESLKKLGEKYLIAST